MNNTEEAGRLALVATPIGNLGDMTYRAVRILKESDIIACEDTRRASKLCNHYEIKAKLTPYHAHNEHRRTAAILERVKEGKKVAVLSDAGTPVISDPGFLIVRSALEEGIEPLIIPGVSALTFGIAAAGLPADRFAFHGFPPVKSGKRKTFFEQLRDSDTSVVLFESPHRVSKLLGNVSDIIGPETPLALIREATKIHEECIRGTAENLYFRFKETKWKGEFVVVINIRKKRKQNSETDLE